MSNFTGAPFLPELVFPGLLIDINMISKHNQHYINPITRISHSYHLITYLFWSCFHPDSPGSCGRVYGRKEKIQIMACFLNENNERGSCVDISPSAGRFGGGERFLLTII